MFGFLFNTENLKSLDDTELRNCCTNFVKTFSLENKSNIELNYSLWITSATDDFLPDDLMSATWILQFVTAQIAIQTCILPIAFS